jgi:glutathione S-transferase
MLKFYYSPGACSIAAHIALEVAGAEFTPVRKAIMKKENLSPEFLAINPQGRVPTLAVDDTIITELPAILLYVDRAFPQAGLMPTEPVAFARAMSMMAFLASNVHISLATIWRPERFSDDKTVHAALEADGMRHMQNHFALIESRLQDGQWLSGGAQPCLADINLLPFYRFGLRLELPMSIYARYSALVARAETMPAVRRVLERERVESFLSPTPAAL